VTVTQQPNGQQPGESNGRHAAEPSVGQLVSEASTHFSTLLHGEIELAKLELKSSVKNAGVGIGLFGAAVVLLVFSLTFGLIALAEGIHTLGIWHWASYLIVFGFLLVLVIVLVLIGVKKVKRVRAPQRTIATSKDTVAYLKANTRRA
jgi:hypothetical protein